MSKTMGLEDYIKLLSKLPTAEDSQAKADITAAMTAERREAAQDRAAARVVRIARMTTELMTEAKDKGVVADATALANLAEIGNIAALSARASLPADLR